MPRGIARVDQAGGVNSSVSVSNMLPAQIRTHGGFNRWRANLVWRRKGREISIDQVNASGGNDELYAGNGDDDSYTDNFDVTSDYNLFPVLGGDRRYST